MRYYRALSFVLVIAGCYRYVPEQGVEPMPGNSYRAHLSTAGSERLQSLLGRDITQVDGRVVSVSDTSFLIAMGATVSRFDPRPTIWSGEQLYIPRSTVDLIERRELDRKRTVRAVTIGSLGLLALGGLFISIGGRVSGDNTVPPGPPPP